MVKSRKEKRSETKALSISHPNSRKALRLAKQVIKESARNKSKLGHAIKRNIFGEKLLWFQEHLDSRILVYTPQHFAELIQKFISRNDDELEQIKLKHSIGQRKNRQHASREDIIRITKERELEEFNGAGIEMVDILIPKNLEAFRKWDGNLGRLGLLKMGKFSKTFLEKYKVLPATKELLVRQELSRTDSVSEEEMEEDVEQSDIEDESKNKDSNTEDESEFVDAETPEVNNT